jgi:hypothetical protein
MDCEYHIPKNLQQSAKVSRLKLIFIFTGKVTVHATGFAETSETGWNATAQGHDGASKAQQALK